MNTPPIRKTPPIKTVLIEYSPTDKRVMVRGVWWSGDALPTLKPLAPGNQQNWVDCFEGVDMGKNVGFSDLERPAWSPSMIALVAVFVGAMFGFSVGSLFATIIFTR